jgi:hypothetical protein
MAKNVVEFEFSLKQSVKIKSIEITGKIDSMSLDVNGKMYRVVYWYNGTRNQTWLYDWEIE